MNYKELVFTIISEEEYHQDVLIECLGNIGFDTFEETPFGFKAYIPSNDFNEELVQTELIPFKEDFSFSYEINLIPQKNWNEVWESNFEPIQIKDEVYVRATFHEPKPNFKYEIVIDPKMAFGTGHHQTTAMLMEYILETDFRNKSVLDMGCGTGILAILSSKRGAKVVMAIDNDDVCYESAKENALLNGIENIKALCGSKEVIPFENYDIILANINRNVLINQMSAYAERLQTKGTIFFSGFYEEPDLAIITKEAKKYNLRYVNHKKTDNWVSAKFVS